MWEKCGICGEDHSTFKTCPAVRKRRHALALSSSVADIIQWQRYVKVSVRAAPPYSGRKPWAYVRMEKHYPKIFGKYDKTGEQV